MNYDDLINVVRDTLPSMKESIGDIQLYSLPDYRLIKDDKTDQFSSNNKPTQNFLTINDLHENDSVEVRNSLDNISVVLNLSNLELQYQNASLILKFSTLHSTVYDSYRIIRGDGNCYYRCVIFAVLERIIKTKKLQSFLILKLKFESLLDYHNTPVVNEGKADERSIEDNVNMTMDSRDLVTVTVNDEIGFGMEGNCIITEESVNNNVISVVDDKSSGNYGFNEFNEEMNMNNGQMPTKFESIDFTNNSMTDDTLNTTFGNPNTIAVETLKSLENQFLSQDKDNTKLVEDVSRVADLLDSAFKESIWLTTSDLERDFLNTSEDGIDSLLIRLCRKLVSKYLIENSYLAVNN